MKILFVGGTGNISSEVSRLLVKKGIELFHFNRGNRELIPGVNSITGDINNVEETREILKNHRWDVVVNWIAFHPNDILRDIQLFSSKTKQYIFISSASAYQKPPKNYIITEKTPLENPFWDYSQNKIECENILMNAYRTQKFPVTIVRPSHTYNTVIPITLGGWEEYTTVSRIKQGQPIVIQGDGTSLWTITHARDFAIGFAGLLGNYAAIGESFHITSDEALTWNQIYNAVAQAVNCTPEVIHIPSQYICEFADTHHFPSVRGSLIGDKMYSAVFDNSKIKLFVPEFKASIPFEQGIKETITWFEADEKRMKINPVTNTFLNRLIETYSH